MKIDFRETCRAELEKTIEMTKEFSWESAEDYAMWSAQTHYFVNHSTRLFALAASRCPIDSKGNGFHFKYLSHLQEERGHENLCIKDLRAIGRDIKSLPELPETRALYQSQYYWIEHEHSYAFYGYLLALEGLAVYAGGDICKRVVAAHGHEAACFLRVHTEEDVDHLADVYKWLDKMDDSCKDQVLENLKMSAKMYFNMLGSIAACSAQDQQKRAA